MFFLHLCVKLECPVGYTYNRGCDDQCICASHGYAFTVHTQWYVSSSRPVLVVLSVHAVGSRELYLCRVLECSAGCRPAPVKDKHWQAASV